MRYLGLIAAAALVAAYFLANSQGVAAPLCAPVGVLERALESRFSEHAIAAGVDSHGWRRVLFTSKEGSTWTILAVRADGSACVVADGVDWESIGPPSDISLPPFDKEAKSR
ncbi:MAG: hypothetical protein HQ495_04415 [Alphaproteobacteria bacterium]|nr:hypothetical protein [Alphaproteobacteria bacterium]